MHVGSFVGACDSRSSSRPHAPDLSRFRHPRAGGNCLRYYGGDPVKLPVKFEVWLGWVPACAGMTECGRFRCLLLAGWLDGARGYPQDSRDRRPRYSPTAVACYDPAMKVRDVLRLLRDDGWNVVTTRGSHRQFKHQTKPGRVTVAGHEGDDVAPGTLNSILKQAGLKG